MTNRHVGTISAAITLLLGIGTMACAPAAQGARMNNDRRYEQSLSARQNGYEHAYRDGSDRGREDRDRIGPAYNLDNADYRKSDRGYSSSMGNKTEYQLGYREGYRAGYDDAYKGRTRPGGTTDPLLRR